MVLLMTIVCIIVFSLLVIIAGVVPKHAKMSGYELKRRKGLGETHAVAVLHREARLTDVISLLRAITALLLVLFVVASVTAFGFFLGIILSLIVALEYGVISRITIIRRWSQKLYEHYEANLLDFVERFVSFFRVLRSVTPEPLHEPHLDSREELIHLITISGGILSHEERKLITNGLQFGARQVNEIMTPRSVIDSIAHRELLGPLVLDDLHKTGHNRFPVTNGDIDHVIGMLHIQNLLTIDIKRSMTAEKAMEPRVFYIREDQTLSHALTAFLSTHHHLFVVVNESRETVGLLSLEDVIEAQLGRKIIDEFGAHDDLGAVAQRKPHNHNHPKMPEDV